MGELLGRIANGEAIGVDVLEGLAFAVLDADEITRLAMRVLDVGAPHRLTRAIELAARVIERETLDHVSIAPRGNEPDTLASR